MTAYMLIALSISLLVIAIKSYKPFLEVFNGNKDNRANKQVGLYERYSSDDKVH